MNQLHILIRELRYFLILWATQALSTLGSSMTGFALIIWSYQQEGSALTTALLSVCSYVPYVLMSIFAARNTLQFFTIPIGYFLGGILVDRVFEPFMAAQSPDSVLSAIFGSGKGSGAALLFLILAVTGVLVCILFRKDPHIWDLEKRKE